MLGLCILAMPRWYRALLSWHHITIDPQPSWESHSLHDNMGEVECIQPLAMRGLTLDEADNCHTFICTWIEEGNTPEKKDT